MRSHLRIASLLLLIAAVISAAEAQDVPTTAPTANPNAATQPSDRTADEHGWTPPLVDACARMMQLAQAIAIYQVQHNGQMPKDLGALLSRAAGGDGSLPARRINLFLTPGDERRITLPAKPTADWVNRNTSYVYLTGGLNTAAIKDPNTKIMLHTKLDAPFTHPKDGDVIVATFIDGHSMILTVDSAKRQIKESKKAFDAARAVEEK